MKENLNQLNHLLCIGMDANRWIFLSTDDSDLNDVDVRYVGNEVGERFEQFEFGVTESGNATGINQFCGDLSFF